MTVQTTADAAAPAAAGPEVGEVDTADQTEAPVDHDDTEQDDSPADDDPGDGKPGRDAAKYRKKLREAEAANAALIADHARQVTELETAHAATSATLAAQRMAVVDLAIRSARFDPDAFRPHLLVALGDDGVDGLLNDDGVVDIGKLTAAVKSTAAAFNPRPTGPRPNSQQGMPSQGGPAATWSSVIGGRR